MCFCLSVSAIIDLILKIATFILASLTVFKAFVELKENRHQRKMELRQKQAEEAKKLIDQWLDDEEAYDAIKMIEYENREFSDEKENKFSVTFNLIIQCLNTKSLNRDFAAIYVCDAFDSFLYYTELMEQGINSDLYTLENLKFPLEYYLSAIVKDGLYSAISNYMAENKFKGSQRLFNEFEIWRNQSLSQ